MIFNVTDFHVFMFVMQALGVLMAFVGAVLVALFDGTDFSQRSPWGTIAMLVNTFSYALYTVIPLSSQVFSLCDH